MQDSMTPPALQVQQAIFGEVRKHWGWLFALGIVFVLLGTIGLGMTAFLTVTSMLFFGVLLLIGGGAELVQAFRAKGWRSMLWSVLIAAVYIVGGIVVINNPLVASSAITLMLGGVFVASGIMRLIIAFQMRHFREWIWPALGGLLSIVLGVLIFSEWPVSAIWVIGLFIAIEMIVHGWSLVALALAARNAPIGEDEDAAGAN
jgi:uncharacterized membrane protein HdeD (DUF308 family)